MVDEARATGYRGLRVGFEFLTSCSILPLWFTLAGKHSRAQGRLFAEQPCGRSILSITLGR